MTISRSSRMRLRLPTKELRTISRSNSVVLWRSGDSGRYSNCQFRKRLKRGWKVRRNGHLILLASEFLANSLFQSSTSHDLVVKSLSLEDLYSQVPQDHFLPNSNPLRLYKRRSPRPQFPRTARSRLRTRNMINYTGLPLNCPHLLCMLRASASYSSL